MNKFMECVTNFILRNCFKLYYVIDDTSKNSTKNCSLEVYVRNYIEEVLVGQN